MSREVEQQSVERAIKALAGAISEHITRPVYLRFEMRDGQLAVSQVEYLTPEEFAPIARVDRRTVYDWIDKGLLSFCKPQGTGQNLIPLHKAIQWIDSSETVREPKKGRGATASVEG